MNKKSVILLGLLIGVGVFFSFRLIADHNQYQYDPKALETYPNPVQDAPKNRNEAIQQTIMNIIRDGHFQPKALDDDFSKKAFDKYLEFTDFGKSFFTQADIDEFSKLRLDIDDQIRNNSTELFDLVYKRINARIETVAAFYPQILSNRFSFDADESIDLDGKKLNWCKDDKELLERWTKSLKYRTLARYTELKEQEEKESKDKKTEKKSTTAELEAKARESVKKNMDLYFKRVRKINANDRFSHYVNAICHIVDPHTDYFPPKDKQRFDEEMSGKFFGIGAQLQSDGDNCKITQVIVGTPAYRSGKIKKEDIILKVAQSNEEPVDISGWDIEDIVSIIRGKENTEVNLTIKHIDGNIEVIRLIRGKVEFEATFAKSAIIKNGNKKIGYIILPEFYADFNDRNGRRCAVDVANEIQKLKSEHVDGIIFDVRNNGGGSLSDVVDIAGLFIPSGPIVQVKSKGEQAQQLSDRNKDILYDGPLVILINQASASASEILAAAMQDYNRAIIMGANSFGKGTVQRIFPLEQFYQANPEYINENEGGLGSIKLTLQKFYRINGGSTQLKGVSPDITVPDVYDFIDLGERKDSNSLPWDMIPKADYKTVKNNVDFEDIIERAKSRIMNSESFKLIVQNAMRLKKQSDDNLYSLNETKFKAQIQEGKDLAKKLEDADKKLKNNEVTNLQSDMVLIKKDTTTIEKNKEWLKLLKNDPYITEATNVVTDWIMMSKNEPLGKINQRKN
ncbi:MAG: carboxy terminal-processing peptidase [Chitinophagaceae bacterium]